MKERDRSSEKRRYPRRQLIKIIGTLFMILENLYMNDKDRDRDRYHRWTYNYKIKVNRVSGLIKLNILYKIR